MVISSALVMAPPCPIPATAVLPLKVLPVMVTSPSEPFHTAPPLPAVLPSKVEPVMVMAPSLVVSPESFLIAPPMLLPASLPVKVLSVMVTSPSRLLMAPAMALELLAKVTPSTVSIASAAL